MTAYYDDDLAYIHQAGFGSFARGAAPGLLELLARHNLHEGMVVDLGCGSGIWAAELLAAGYDVTGIDISTAMIKIARRTAPAGRFIAGSFMETDIPPCAAVTSLSECLNYRFDRRAGKQGLKPLFGRVYNALQPGGVFVFDVLKAQPGPSHQKNNRVGDDWAVLVDVDVNKPGTTLTRQITSFRRRGQDYRRSDEVHKQQLYRPEELETMLRTIGFRVRRLRSYGRQALALMATAFVARKP